MKSGTRPYVETERRNEAAVHYRNSHEFRQRLEAADSTKVRAQRDLLTGYVKMAIITDDLSYAETAYEMVLDMQAKGTLDPTDEYLIESLREVLGR